MGSQPYFLLRARLPSSLVISCEHASASLPAGLGADGATRRILRTHRGWDIGAWDVAREVSRRLKATAAGGRYSRLVVDLNRDPSDPTLIMQETDGVRISFNAGLTPAERRRRVARFHAPFHAELDRQLAFRVAAGMRPLLISFHSFTPTINPRRRRFGVGVLFSDNVSLALFFGRLLRTQGFSVRFNRPYSGLDGLIYSASRHGSSHRLPHLELEINQRLLMDPRRRGSVGRKVALAVTALIEAHGRAI